MKKRVLVNNEASYLNTGYATYGRNLIKRLIDRGYEVAEISCYGTCDDERRSKIPWKNYPVAPCKNDTEEVHKIYHSNPANQFGAWRFERICLDFKPDIVISQKDPWMESFIMASPVRPFFSWAWAPTCDSMPQSDEWISQFANADYLYGLSNWGGDVIKNQGGKSIKYFGSVTSAAPDHMVPLPNKEAVKLSIGINPDWSIIGTIMRNQRRKLFPELFEAFSNFLEAAKTANLKDVDLDKIYLHCHTSYPDHGGWDIPKLLVKYNIANKVLFTYTCKECKNWHVSLFSDALKYCTVCKKHTCIPVNVSNGLSDSDLAKIYNSFDIYVQYANSEGQGLGQLEAAACAVPVASIDFSAMEDIIRKIGGYPVKVKHLNLELETGCHRAIPDNDDFVKYLLSFYGMSSSLRKKIGLLQRDNYLANYDWEKITDKWCIAINDCPKANWNKPFRNIQPPKEIPKIISNYDFINWAIQSFLPHSDLIGTYETNSMIRDLNFGRYKAGPCGYFYSDNSYFDRAPERPFSREVVIEMLSKKSEIFTFWEKVRAGIIQLPQENWLD